MKSWLKKKRDSKKWRTACCTALMMMVCAFPAFAEGGTEVSGMLSTFTTVQAWILSEIGLLVTWIVSQPVLMVAMSLFFCGAIISFFIRIFHSV